MPEGKVSPRLLKRQAKTRKLARKKNKRVAEGLGGSNYSFKESLKDTLDQILGGPPPLKKDK